MFHGHHQIVHGAARSPRFKSTQLGGPPVRAGGGDPLRAASGGSAEDRKSGRKTGSRSRNRVRCEAFSASSHTRHSGTGVVNGLSSGFNDGVSRIADKVLAELLGA